MPRSRNEQNRGAGHRQRLRDRFLEYGLSAFTDDEILELLLSFGTPRQDCKERARAALKRFGSLSGVLEASLDALQEVPGIGAKNAFAIKFIHEVARKFLRERVEGRPLVRVARDVVDYLWHSLSFRNREVFVVVFLDARHCILTVEEMFQGTINYSAVYPREVIRKALELHAAAMVLAHNHPSGDARPSGQDRKITSRLYQAARLLDMEVLDHIVVGRLGEYFSFEEKGLMSLIRREAGASHLGPP